MKLSTLKNLAVASVSACVLFASITSAGKDFTFSIPSVGDRTLLPVLVVAPQYYPISKYIDLEVQCSNAVSILQQYQHSAGMHINTDFDKASGLLYKGIQEGAMRSQGRVGMANAHTVVAMQSALRMANVVMTELPKFKPVLGATEKALRARFLNKITDLVIKTYNELDRPYFFRSIGHCRGHHCYTDYSQNLDFLSLNYFTKMGEVAEGFIDLYTSNERVFGHNLFEAVFASNASAEAAEILATSAYRRDYACAVTRLANLNTQLQADVQEYLSNPNPWTREEDMAIAIGNARSQMYWANQQIKSVDKCW